MAAHGCSMLATAFCWLKETRSDVKHGVLQRIVNPFQPGSPIPVEGLLGACGCIVSSVELPVQVRSAAFAEQIGVVGRGAKRHCFGCSAVQITEVVGLKDGG